jgi:predicted Zn-dependent protease with MMP-like domain
MTETSSEDELTWEDEFERLLDEDPEAALEEALAWVDEEPDSPDAHHAAGVAYEVLGEREDQVSEFLEVLRLDSLGPPSAMLHVDRIVHEEAERVLERLPAHIKNRLGPVAILVEPRPSADLVRDGFDPRLLGFFDGATSEELSGTDAPPLPTRILLFSENLAAAFLDEESLRAEVEITVLHELGHFFGLDEDDMVRLGLD